MPIVRSIGFPVWATAILGSLMGKILRIEEVPLDVPLVDSLYDADGKLLMTRGSIVTSDQLKSLALKGLRYLELGELAQQQDTSDVVIATIESFDSQAIDRTSDEHLRSYETIDRFSDSVVSTIRPINPRVSARVAQLVAEAAETVEELGKQLADGTLRDATPIRTYADKFLTEIQGDVDQTVATVLNQAADEELAVRSVQLSVLSIAISRAMKLTLEEQVTVGCAAMLHDMALFELPEYERHSPELMRPESRRVYESHPAIAYDMLEKVRDIDGTVRIIVLQTHEQADGTGFPRRISTPRIHRLARVVNLADAYLRLTGIGTGSQKLFPADAIAYLMHHSCQGRFDAEATCGLVRAVSLYPLGSLVVLSDNRQARIARASAKNPSSPVVSTTDENGETVLIDLSKDPLTISRPIDEDNYGRRRLPASELEKILW